MISAKKKQPEPTLAERITELRYQVDYYIDQKTMELKNSSSGRDQPIQVLRHMLKRGDSCLCRCALRLLEEQGDE